ncbi:MAG: NIL domain-containing protein [Chloroflexota bacterium]
MAITRRVVIRFPPSLVEQPVMCRLAREYNLDFNILKASVTPREEGVLVVELNGDDPDYENGMDYLNNIGVEVQPLSQDVVRNEERCTHCGACVALCPTGALSVESGTMRINFDNDKCVACGICVPACPARAMEIRF